MMLVLVVRSALSQVDGEGMEGLCRSFRPLGGTCCWQRRV
jgi:hypothetical protein